jgi:hypothetical protein
VFGDAGADSPVEAGRGGGGRILPARPARSSCSLVLVGIGRCPSRVRDEGVADRHVVRVASAYVRLQRDSGFVRSA